MGLLFVPVATVGVVLIIKDPDLLERRMRTREREAPQRKVIAVSSLLLLALLLIPGFDRRYSWSTVPPSLVVLADILILLGYLLFVLTIRENRFASRVVEVQEDQVVVSTGPYALVRHPIYLAVSLIFTFPSLSLSSYFALLPFIGKRGPPPPGKPQRLAQAWDGKEMVSSAARLNPSRSSEVPGEIRHCVGAPPHKRIATSKSYL